MGNAGMHPTTVPFPTHAAWCAEDLNQFHQAFDNDTKNDQSSLQKCPDPFQMFLISLFLL